MITPTQEIRNLYKIGPRLATSEPCEVCGAPTSVRWDMCADCAARAEAGPVHPSVAEPDIWDDTAPMPYWEPMVSGSYQMPVPPVATTQDDFERIQREFEALDLEVV